MNQECGNPPIAIAIDTNVVDVLLDDTALADQARALVMIGAITISHTHIQTDEIVDVPDDKAGRRQDLIATLAGTRSTREATAVFVLDHSRLGEAELGSEEASAVCAGLLQHGGVSIEDAIIGTTAFVRGQVLVTNDQALQKQARRLGNPCWSSEDMRANLCALDRAGCTATGP